MTFTLWPEGEIPNYAIRKQYSDWCWINVYEDKKALTWKIFGNKIIFLNDEDATAFRLRFYDLF